MLQRDLVAFGVVPASGVLMLDLGGPSAGFVWDLRDMVIANQISPQTAAAATIFVTTPKGDPGPAGIMLTTEIVDVTTTGIPVAGTWSRGTIMLHPGERIQVWIFGLAAGTNIIATAQAEEERA